MKTYRLDDRSIYKQNENKADTHTAWGKETKACAIDLLFNIVHKRNSPNACSRKSVPSGHRYRTRQEQEQEQKQEQEQEQEQEETDLRCEPSWSWSSLLLITTMSVIKQRTTTGD